MFAKPRWAEWHARCGKSVLGSRLTRWATTHGDSALQWPPPPLRRPTCTVAEGLGHARRPTSGLISFTGTFRSDIHVSRSDNINHNV